MHSCIALVCQPLPALPQPTISNLQPLIHIRSLLPPPHNTSHSKRKQGIEVGIGLLEKAGPAVCKFGPDALKPVLEQTIDSLLKQTPEQLSRLPQLSVAVAMVDPKTLGVSSTS